MDIEIKNKQNGKKEKLIYVKKVYDRINFKDWEADLLMLKKRFLSWTALGVCSALLLGACGNSENGGVQPGSQAQEPQNASSAERGNQSKGTDASGNGEESTAVVDWEDMAEIELFYFTFVSPKDVQHVEDAINTITEEKINTHVNITVMDVNSYIQQIGIMMAGNEQIDLMLTAFSSASYSAMMAQNQLMDISEYVDTYGPDITSTLGDMLKATTVGDGVYGVPCYRNVISSNYVFMREDVLEDLGLLEKARNMTSFEEFEEILQAVKNSEKWNYLQPYMYQSGSGPMQPNANVSGAFADADVFDTLGDTLGIVRLDKNGKVTLNMESDSYQQAAAMVRGWNEKGLSYFDMSGSGGSCEDYIKSDAVFSFISTAEFGAENAKSVAAGMPMVAVKLYDGEVNSEACTKFAYCVPTTSKEPEAAIAFLNLAITDPQINNLMAWGVEGVDYEVVDGVAQYIEGNEKPDYHLFDYSVPNQFLVYPWSGDPADFREQSEADLKAAPVSDYLGFSCDLTAFVNETAAVSNVIEEYRDQIGSGQASEAVLQEYIDKLHSVNVQVILDEYQKQLDAWLTQ